MKEKIILTAAIFGGLAVIAGAFGAHALQQTLSPKNIEIWKTAVQYQFYHTFALLFLATIARYKTSLIKHAYWLFSLGIILFSGSLYLLACRDLIGWKSAEVIGPVTPAGGLLLIAGWIILAFAAFKKNN